MTDVLTFEVSYTHDCPPENDLWRTAPCSDCGAIVYPTPSGKVGVRWLVPVDTKPSFQLTIMRGSKVVKRWPMRNEARAVKGKADWENDRDTRSVYFKGCEAVIERREVTPWRR